MTKQDKTVGVSPAGSNPSGANPTCVNPDIVRWNRKYTISPGSTPERVEACGEPELVAHSHLIEYQGRALELASGRGRNALYVASKGYRVIAADCAVNALLSCRDSATEAGLPVYAMACDLEYYRFPSASFDLVSVIRFLHRPLLPAIHDWLRPGGILFYKTFSTGFLSINPRFNPDYLVEPGELLHAFRDLDLLASDLDQWPSGENPETGTSFILARNPQ